MPSKKRKGIKTMRIELDIPFTLAEIARITDGHLLEKNAKVCAISTDSRECFKNDIFFALNGNNFCGNDFLREAKARGAFTVSDREDTTLQVNSARTALLKLATAYKEKISPKITVAITGSTGKTTVKEFLAEMLKTKFKTHKSFENYNNDLGLTHTLLSSPHDAEAFVCELGMNKEKEIEILSNALHPTVSVITNVGTAHIGELGSRESIARAKLEIERGMNGGKVIIFDNEPLLRDAKNPYFVSEENENADLIFRVLSKVSSGSTVYIKTKTDEMIAFSHLTSEHHLRDIALCVATCDVLGFSKFEICDAIKSISEKLLRQREICVGKYRFYDDSYNSSAEAVIANLKMLSERSDNNSALLGDMLELGEEGEKLHYEIGLATAKYNFKKIYSFGNYSKFIAAGAQDGGIKEENIFINQNLTKPELTAKAIIESYNGETILAKASHSIKIDRIFRLISVMEGENAND